MDSDAGLADRLRDRILNSLHLGLLRPGDRLPSIRTLWREMGVDHRVVAQAYRTLEAEGLVEVRGRSGVYLAPQDQFGGELLAETARWLAGVLVEAWKRRMTISELPDLIRRCTGSVRLRCGVIESIEDQMTAYTAELEEQFGLDPVPIYISPIPLPRPDRSVEFHGVEERLRDLDLVVTTSYHARLVRKAADNVGIPAVVLTVNPEVVETIQRHIRERPLTVIALESTFGDRMRAMYAEEQPDRIHTVLAADREAIARLDPDEQVLLTRAARQRLGDEVELPMLLPHSPTFSPHTARELLGIIIRLNVEASKRDGHGMETMDR
ncbi:MAG TPA: winged helix-turn-helix domain-containing protein [Longimicrobium sp.]|nr:winged helix-turn-helix domain-containing protein [Longimicrobium sp.]